MSESPFTIRTCHHDLKNLITLNLCSNINNNSALPASSSFLLANGIVCSSTFQPFLFFFAVNTVHADTRHGNRTVHVVKLLYHKQRTNAKAVCTEPFTRNVQQPLCKCTITPRTCGSHNALAVQAITRGRRDKNCWLFLHTGRACKATDILTDSCDTFRPADIQYSTQHRL